VENTLMGGGKKKKSLLLIWLIFLNLTGGENVDEKNINEWINCDANDPGFERLSDEQIVSGALGTVSEKDGEENVEVKQVSYEAALKHIDGIIKYLEEQDDTTVCDKMLPIKKTSITS